MSLSLVAAGLAVIPLLSHATEVLTTTLLVLPTAAFGGHLMWRGVRLIRTRDFSGTKLHGAIDPKKLAAASYYFGVWEIGLGVLSASSVLVVVGQPSHRKLWIAGYLLCGLALFVAGFLFVRPRAS